MKQKPNNRKGNCGRKSLDWINKKSQITLSVPNVFINEVSKHDPMSEKRNEKGKTDFARHYFNQNINQIIEVLK